MRLRTNYLTMLAVGIVIGLALQVIMPMSLYRALPQVPKLTYDASSANTELLHNASKPNVPVVHDGNDGYSPPIQEFLPPLHVMFALSGNHPGVLAEFEVALKSALLNAPMERDLFVHILADVLAYDSMEEIYNRTQLATWITRNKIEIHTYDVMPHMKELQVKIADTFKNMDMGPTPMIIHKATRLHTLGTFYRLIAHLVLPSSVEHLLYIDTDVVVMANLEGLFGQIQTKPDALFHWGSRMCAGFLVLNVKRMEEIWSIAKESPLKTISERYKQDPNDQLIFRSVNVTRPDEVNILEPGWDMDVAGLWNKKPNEHGESFPDTGMLHINGGSANKDAYFEKPRGFMEKYPLTWGNAKYYVTLPWTWARYHARTLVKAGSSGYPMQICSWGPNTESNNSTLQDDSTCVKVANAE